MSADSGDRLPEGEEMDELLGALPVQLSLLASEEMDQLSILASEGLTSEVLAPEEMDQLSIYSCIRGTYIRGTFPS